MHTVVNMDDIVVFGAEEVGDDFGDIVVVVASALIETDTEDTFW